MHACPTRENGGHANNGNREPRPTAILAARENGGSLSTASHPGGWRSVASERTKVRPVTRTHVTRRFSLPAAIVAALNNASEGETDTQLAILNASLCAFAASEYPEERRTSSGTTAAEAKLALHPRWLRRLSKAARELGRTVDQLVATALHRGLVATGDLTV